MDSATPVEKSALALRQLLRFATETALEIGPDDYVFDAPGVEAVAAECAAIVLDTGDAARAGTLLAAGATCVLLGELALTDSAAVGRLAQAHPGQVGIYAPVKRQAVNWSFETVSNADFKTVTPSYCEPAWEVLKSDGMPTGTLAGWWLKAMRNLGASHFLLAADVGDDTDLNILAGLVEDFGNTLWVGPRVAAAVALTDWVCFGHCQQLALPSTLYAQRDILLADLLQTTPETA